MASEDENNGGGVELEVNRVATVSLGGNNSPGYKSDENEDSALADELAKLEGITNKKTCCGRLKLLLCPIQSFKNITISKTSKDGSKAVVDTATHVIILPESLRILGYVNFVFFICVSIVVAIITGTPNYYNNGVRDYFGISNVCIFFDDPPMVYIIPFWYGTFVLIPICSYLVLDNFRVYDRYKDESHAEYKTITKKFYIGYSIASVYIITAFLAFQISFGTSPYENTTIHTLPFLFCMFAWVILSFQKIIYFHKIGIWEKFSSDNRSSLVKCVGPKVVRLLGITYVAILTSTVVIAALLNGFGSDAMWGKPAWRFVVSEINDKILTVFILVVPIGIYFWFTPKLETIEIVINRRET